MQLFSFLQESLRKITHTLATKNEEISNFVCSLKQSLDNLEVMTYEWWMNEHGNECGQSFLLPHQGNSTRVQEDLESEFNSLHSVLDEMKENMLTRIKQERASRTYELQVSMYTSHQLQYEHLL